MRKKVLPIKRALATMLAAVMACSGMGLAASASPALSAAPAAGDSEPVPPYLDTSLSFEERAADLVSRMTLEEKASQLGNSAAAIPRLGVKGYQYWNEALHGVARSGEATSFPTGLGMATTWNRELVTKITSATSDEARAYNNKKGKELVYWSPTINMSRDPRWGRAEETYGEDPYLTAQIGSSFVNGLQGDDERYLKAVATIKHYAANNSEFNRHNGNSEMEDRTLREYYTKAFKDVIAATDVQSVMSSYNRVNGIPASANTYLLDTLLRKSWGFGGFVVSDCDAIWDIVYSHRWQPADLGHAVNEQEATAYSLRAGCDLNCGSIFPQNAAAAVKAGILSEDTVDMAVLRLFIARMKTGEFDPKEMVPYTSAEYSWENQISADDHVALAEKSAEEALVLLKNEAAANEQNAILPLNPAQNNRVVVIGDMADEVTLGDYSGTPREDLQSSPLEGITNLLKSKNPNAEVTYIPAYEGEFTKGGYVFNVKNFDLKGASGDVYTRLEAKDCVDFAGLQVENDSNFGYVNSGAWAKYENVFIGSISEITARVSGDSGNASHGYIEVRLDSSNGPLISKIATQPTSG